MVSSDFDVTQPLIYIHSKYTSEYRNFNMTASKQSMEHSTYAMFSHKSLTSKNEFKTCRMHNALLLCAAINNNGQWVIFTTVYTAILTATNPHL